MRTFRIKRDPWTVLAGILHAHESFTTAGSMRGELNVSPSQGHMPADEYRLMRDRAEKNELGTGKLDYAVYSYATIIGYRVNNTWYVPDCTYSITTTIQQNKLRTAVGTYVS